VLGVDAKADFDSGAFGVARFSGVEGIAHDSVDFGAKFCGAQGRPFKHIPISDCAPNVEEFVVFLHRQKVFVQNDGAICADGLTAPNETGLWRDTPVSEIKVLWQRRIPQRGIYK
jgi:hypothetical protein